VIGQRNGRSPCSLHFQRKVILNSVKLQNTCSRLACKQDPSLDHTVKDPTKDCMPKPSHFGRFAKRAKQEPLEDICTIYVEQLTIYTPPVILHTKPMSS